MVNDGHLRVARPPDGAHIAVRRQRGVPLTADHEMTDRNPTWDLALAELAHMYSLVVFGGFHIVGAEREAVCPGQT